MQPVQTNGPIVRRWLECLVTAASLSTDQSGSDSVNHINEVDGANKDVTDGLPDLLETSDKQPNVPVGTTISPPPVPQGSPLSVDELLRFQLQMAQEQRRLTQASCEAISKSLERSISKQQQLRELSSFLEKMLSLHGPAVARIDEHISEARVSTLR